jgi:hypothetical protein
VRGGSIPSSFSCAEVRVNKAFQEGILEACWLKLRPMRLRKVCVLGTNGVGLGIGDALTVWWRHRTRKAAVDCVKGSRKEAIGLALEDLAIIISGHCDRA